MNTIDDTKKPAMANDQGLSKGFVGDGRLLCAADNDNIMTYR